MCQAAPAPARPSHMSWGRHGRVGTRALAPGLHSIPHCAEERGGPAGHTRDAGPDHTQARTQRPEQLPELPARGGEDAAQRGARSRRDPARAARTRGTREGLPHVPASHARTSPPRTPAHPRLARPHAGHTRGPPAHPCLACPHAGHTREPPVRPRLARRLPLDISLQAQSCPRPPGPVPWWLPEQAAVPLAPLLRAARPRVSGFFCLALG